MDKEGGAQAISGWGDRVPLRARGPGSIEGEKGGGLQKAQKVRWEREKTRCFMAEWKDPQT